MTDEETLLRAHEDAFDALIDRICVPGSPYGYEEAVHLASNLYDDQNLGAPYPIDYLPPHRRRLVTGGA